MADRDPAELARENAYLKLRNAQLQSDIIDLSAEVERLRQLQDRLHARKAVQNPGSPAGCQEDSVMSDDARVQGSAASVAEAGVMEEPVMAEYGITRVPIDYFHVGGYRYTGLQEAIAGAKRQRSAPRSL